MKFHSEHDARQAGLIPITEWTYNNPNERAFLESFYAGIMKNPMRIAMFVMNSKTSKIALFANNIAINYQLKSLKLSKYATSGRMKSKSSKYKNITHLIETLFFKKNTLTIKEFKAAIKKEFPDSGMCGPDCIKYFREYRHRLIHRKDYQYINIS